MTEFNVIQVSMAGAVGVVVIHRPEKLNAINAQVIDELGAALDVLTAQGARAAVLTGAGEKAFVAGADIGAMAEMSSVEAEAFARRGHALGERMAAVSFPILAAVNGFALGGGCELAMACDLIYASDRARFGLPEVTLGVIPGFGGTQRLARRVGVGKAREMVFTGAPVDAAQALAMGLVDRVFEHDKLREETLAAAERIAANAPLAVGYAKRAMHAGENVPMGVAKELEAQAFGLCFATEDQKTGMRTFVENPRAPRVFKGQ